MTNEEAIKILQNIYFEVPEIKEALQIAIDALSRPSLPSELDEAAQKVEDYYDVGEEHGYLCCHRGDIKNAFKAGAEWYNSKTPKLPDNLDEAAEEYSNIPYNFGDFVQIEYEFGEPIETIVDDKMFVKEAFKDGAEWMAGQGASYNTEVGWIDGPTVLDWPDNILDEFKMGDKVIVQIRKK